MTLGEWMKATREAKDMDAKDCAARAGMSPSFWSRWENDESRRSDGSPSEPRSKAIEQIARGLGVGREDVLKGMGVVRPTSDRHMRLAEKLERHLSKLPADRQDRAEAALVQMAELLVSTAA